MLRTREFGAFVVLVAMLLLCEAGSQFYNQKSFLGNELGRVLKDFSIVAIAAIGACAVIVSGGVDLSAGSTMTLSAYAMAFLFVNKGVPAPVALGAGLATGTLVGLANGLLVGGAKLPPFIATLGMLSIARGLAFWVNDGDNITVAWRSSADAFAGFWLLGDYPMVAVLVLGILASVVMARFRWGRYVYAVGGNEEAARFAGLRIGAIKAGIYAAAGLFSALAGCTYSLKYGTTMVTMGNGYELQIIAACAIGGVSFSGGQGTVAGSVIGAAILQTLYELLLQLRVPGDRIEIFYGAAILLAVGIDQVRRGGLPARWFSRSAT